MTKRQTEAYMRGEHVMNKIEASLMRRIQSETGLSEEEVRSKKKYRVMLSDTQVSSKVLELKRRRTCQVHGTPAKWNWGSEKTMFKQKAMQVLNDKEATARLYKRYAGGLVDDKHPKAFHYRKFDKPQPETEIMQAIDRTDGQFVYSIDNNEVGFMYAESLTMFSLIYQTL